MTDLIPDFLRPLATLSARLGNDIELVQAAGGNTSLKHERELWVKASGIWLSEALARQIFVPLDLARVRAAVQGPPADIDAAVQAARLGDSPLRPSIETSLHALMPHSIVVHVHGVNTLAHVMLRDGRQRVSDRLNGLPFTWIPYTRPGAPLTVSVREALAAHATDVLVLENHGLVVGAGSAEEAEALLREVERRLTLTARSVHAPAWARLAALASRCGLVLPREREAHVVALDKRSLALARTGAFYPDHVVFLGRSPAPVIPEAELPAWLGTRRMRGEVDPAFVLVPGLGLLARPHLSRSAHELLRCLGLVLTRVPLGAEAKTLSATDEDDLLDWDAEKYRKSLDRIATQA
jgi:rhamnose utilization protein RhaD (predicted bifunctional aldolase and dehydrogenase)